MQTETQWTSPTTPTALHGGRTAVVATCLSPSLSWLAASQVDALQGLEAVVRDVVADMHAQGDLIPTLSDRQFSGNNEKVRGSNPLSSTIRGPRLTCRNVAVGAGFSGCHPRLAPSGSSGRHLGPPRARHIPGAAFRPTVLWDARRARW